MATASGPVVTIRQNIEYVQTASFRLKLGCGPDDLLHALNGDGEWDGKNIKNENGQIIATQVGEDELQEARDADPWELAD